MIKQKAVQNGENKLAASEAEWRFSKKPRSAPLMHRRKMKDQKEIIIFKQFCQTQTHLSRTWRGKQSVVIIKKACTCFFFNKYFMICHLLPREAITHHSHCILSSCGMTKTELIMLRSYEFRIEGSES